MLVEVMRSVGAVRAVIAAVLLAVSAAACSHSPASAQDQPGTGAPAAAGARQRMGAFLKSLGLSDAQKKQIRAIVADARKQNQGVTDRATRRANMQAAYDKIGGVLTPAQKAKFDAYREQMRNRYRNGAGAGAPSGANGN